VLLLIYLFLPLEVDDTWSTSLRSPDHAIGALGLNLLTGYTGLPSLGHAASSRSVGSARATSAVRLVWRLDWPFWAYTLVAIFFGCLVA